jgi:hypothetical protein
LPILKEITKAFLVSLLFFSFFFGLGTYNYSTHGSVSASADFQFHWEKIHDLGLHPEYPALYHVVFQFFGTNELLFYTTNLFLICFLIPLLIFYATKTWWSTIIYFMGINLPHVWLYGATYPEALVFLFLIIYLAHRKNWLVFAMCAGLAFLTHREGAYLFAIVLIAEIVDFLARKVLEGWTKRLKQAPVGIVTLGVQKFGDWAHYLFYLVTQISPVTWFYARKIFFQPFWLVLAAVPLFLLNYDARIISVTGLALLFVSAPEIAKAEHKKIIAVFLLIQLLFFLLEFAWGTTKLIANT